MPGWHAATRKLQEEGSLQTVGIVQEQHPNRTQLFMQWQQMDWPVMVDALNLLGLNVVPVTLLIDEEGIIRFKGSEENLEKFLALDVPDPRPAPRQAAKPQPISAQAAKTPGALLERGDQLFLWGGEESIDAAIDAYGRVVSERPEDGPAHFRLGVAYRERADSGRRHEGDFGRAVENWGKALALDPNQYIWRRRIQQYGPRLEKPYSFYDWVEQARREIEARGETPRALRVEPRGAELAYPSKEFASASGGQGSTERAEPPIGAHRIHRDEKSLIRLETTVVPTRITAGSSARVHLAFRPNVEVRGHWNNEAEAMEIWLEAPEGWQIDQRQMTVANPPQLVSDEERLFELEVKSPENAQHTTLEGFALYYVCEDIGGTCLYRRQDLAIELPVAQ